MEGVDVGWKLGDKTLREVHVIVNFFFRQAASHVSGPDSREEKGDFKGRLKQTSLPVWLIEMEDVQDFARRLQAQETQQLKNICPFFDISYSFCLESLFFPLINYHRTFWLQILLSYLWLLVILKFRISNINLLCLSSLTVKSLPMSPSYNCFSSSFSCSLLRQGSFFCPVIELMYNKITRSDDRWKP